MNAKALAHQIRAGGKLAHVRTAEAIEILANEVGRVDTVAAATASAFSVSGATHFLGDVSIVSVVPTYESPSDNDNVRVKLAVTIAPPSPVGDFTRFMVCVEIPDGSEDIRLRQEFEYTGGGGNQTVNVFYEPPTSNEDWRVYGLSGGADIWNPLVLSGYADASPSVIVNIDPKPEGGSGVEWVANNVSSLTASVEYGVNQVGGQMYRLYGTFTPPADYEYQGVRMVARDGTDDVVLSFEPRGNSAYISPWFPVPESSKSLVVYAQSQGLNYRFNTIVPGTTPSANVTVEHQAGTGGLKLNLADAATFDTSELEVTGGGIFRVKLVDADKIQTGTLKVGGGGTKPGQMGVYDSGGALIGWIGQSGIYYGGYFKQLYVGGTDPSNAPLYADASGNLFITSSAARPAEFSFTGSFTETTIDNDGVTVENLAGTRSARLAQGYLEVEGSSGEFTRVEDDALAVYESSRLVAEVGAIGSSYGLLITDGFGNHDVLIDQTEADFITVPIKMNGAEAIDISRNATFNSLDIDSQAGIDASGNADFLTLDIGGGDFDVDASGNIDGNSLSINGYLTIDSTNNVRANSFSTDAVTPVLVIGSDGQVCVRSYSQTSRPTQISRELSMWWDSDEGGGTMYLLWYDGTNYWKVAGSSA